MSGHALQVLRLLRMADFFGAAYLLDDLVHC